MEACFSVSVQLGWLPVSRYNMLTIILFLKFSLGSYGGSHFLKLYEVPCSVTHRIYYIDSLSETHIDAICDSLVYCVVVLCQCERITSLVKNRCFTLHK